MRTSRSTRTGLVVSAAVLTLALAGCGGDDADGEPDDGDDTPAQHFPDDFEPVCQGATVSTATAYDESATTHKALYFASHDDGLTDKSSELPPDWTVTFSTEGDALAAVDLVLCAVRTNEEFVEKCTGYEDDGVDTGNAVNWHTATYEVSVRAATTGQVLAQESMEADDEECPSFVFFDEDGQTIDQYDSLPEETVVDFLKPFVAP